MNMKVNSKFIGKSTCSISLVRFWLGMGVLILAASPVHGQTSVTSCGQTLSVAGQYVLSSDLDCSGSLANGVNITANKVVFHLAGHTLSSSDCDTSKGIAGVAVSGGVSGVQVEGGTVKGFNDGVDLAATKSRVNAMTISGACVFGVTVSGASNRVDTSVVTLSGVDGVGLGAASGTFIVSNDVSGNTRLGIDISNFSDNNFVQNNIINANGVSAGIGGVAIFNGTNNLISGNNINNNLNGIALESPGNIAQSNSVNGSLDSGIFVLTLASPSVVERNVVRGSLVVDLSDDNESCSGDTWKQNNFVTDLVAGMPDGGPGVGCIQ